MITPELLENLSGAEIKFVLKDSILSLYNEKFEGNDSLCAVLATAETLSLTGVQKLFFWALMFNTVNTVNRVRSTVFFIFW